MKSWFDIHDADATDMCSSRDFAVQVNALALEEPLPEELYQRLQKLSLLYDLPFACLAPRESMLPPESMRFFHLDGDWIFSLLDGALSPGRALEMDEKFDKAIIGSVYRDTINGNHAVRLILQGKEVAPASGDGAKAGIACTGFLLRSVAVSGWRGMEFKAFAGDMELTALRIETLGPEVLFALYRGVISRVEIQQPPEGLHFGLAPGKGGTGFEKRLRSLEDGTLFEPGTLDLDLTPCVDPEENVVDFAQAASCMEARLGDKLQGRKMDASVFALQMIQNAYTAVVTEEDSSQP